MNAAVALIRAARPKTLIASISPVVMGTVLALREGHLSLYLFLMTLATALAIQVATNYVNDAADFKKGHDGPTRKGPPRAVASGWISFKAMRTAYRLTFLCALLFGLALVKVGGLPVGFFLLVALPLGYLYTAGPYPLASRLPGASDIAVLLFFGPISTASTYFLQTGAWLPDIMVAGLAPGAFSWALLLLNNLRDIDEDRNVDKRTLPVVFGMGLGKALFVVALLLCFLPTLLLMRASLDLLPLLALLPAFLLMRQVLLARDGEAMKPLFPRVAALHWIYLLLFILSSIYTS